MSCLLCNKQAGSRFCDEHCHSAHSAWGVGLSVMRDAELRPAPHIDPSGRYLVPRRVAASIDAMVQRIGPRKRRATESGESGDVARPRLEPEPAPVHPLAGTFFGQVPRDINRIVGQMALSEDPRVAMERYNNMPPSSDRGALLEFGHRAGVGQSVVSALTLAATLPGVAAPAASFLRKLTLDGRSYPGLEPSVMFAIALAAPESELLFNTLAADREMVEALKTELGGGEPFTWFVIHHALRSLLVMPRALLERQLLSPEWWRANFGVSYHELARAVAYNIQDIRGPYYCKRDDSARVAIRYVRITGGVMYDRYSRISAQKLLYHAVQETLPESQVVLRVVENMAVAVDALAGLPLSPSDLENIVRQLGVRASLTGVLGGKLFSEVPSGIAPELLLFPRQGVFTSVESIARHEHIDAALAVARRAAALHDRMGQVLLGRRPPLVAYPGHEVSYVWMLVPLMPERVVDYLGADLREPERVLAEATTGSIVARFMREVTHRIDVNALQAAVAAVANAIARRTVAAPRAIAYPDDIAGVPRTPSSAAAAAICRVIWLCTPPSLGRVGALHFGMDCLAASGLLELAPHYYAQCAVRMVYYYTVGISPSEAYAAAGHQYLSAAVGAAGNDRQAAEALFFGQVRQLYYDNVAGAATRINFSDEWAGKAENEFSSYSNFMDIATRHILPLLPTEPRRVAELFGRALREMALVYEEASAEPSDLSPLIIVDFDPVGLIFRGTVNGAELAEVVGVERAFDAMLTAATIRRLFAKYSSVIERVGDLAAPIQWQ